MNIDTISLTDALQLIDSGNVISQLRFVKADKHRGTAGELKSLMLCHKYHTEHKGGVGRGHKATAITPLHSENIIDDGISPFKKNPKHYENSTRNILEVVTGNIYKVHIRLLTSINQKRII
jgi:hypothetical protein